MDTTDQLSGKYFFDGMNVDKEELLYWLILDEFRKQFSDAIDILAVASMLVSLPVIPVSGKLGAGTATKGTSPLSLASRTLIRQRFKKGRRTITWAKMLRGEWAYTTSVGAYIGRWLPWIGAVLTAYDLDNPECHTPLQADRRIGKFKMDKAERVRALLKKHFWDMPDEASLSTGKKTVLPEDALDFFEDYVEQCEVDMTGFNFRCYFPNAGIRFLPNVLLPAYLKTDHHQPEPLTVSMLIASAEAGRWLYNRK